MDKNAQVRNQACKIVLEKKASVEIHRVYLNALYVHTAISIYGLGEVGSCEDCKIIEKFLSDNRISVIRAAMIALMKLNPEKYTSYITDMLAIEELGIVKTATLLLKKTKDYDFERVFEIQNNSLNENTKLKCATLLFLSSKWKSLIYTLMMIGSDYEKLEALCQRKIRRWLFSFNNSFAVLSKNDKDIILRLLNDKAQFLKADIVKEITFVIK